MFSRSPSLTCHLLLCTCILLYMMLLHHIWRSINTVTLELCSHQLILLSWIPHYLHTMVVRNSCVVMIMMICVPDWTIVAPSSFRDKSYITISSDSEINDIACHPPTNVNILCSRGHHIDMPSPIVHVYTPIYDVTSSYLEINICTHTGVIFPSIDPIVIDIPLSLHDGC